jgi:hypothetical protein
MNNPVPPLAVGAVLLLGAASSNAQVVLTAQNGVVGTFGVSSTDLGQAAGTTLSLDSGTESFGSAVGRLNDGDIYGVAGADNTTATLTPSHGAVVTYHFDLTASPSGYDLTAIVSLTGTAQNRAQQVYDVAYSVVGGGGFTPLASVTGSLSGNGSGGETQVTLSNLNLANVTNLRFTFYNGTGGESMYREIDVSGIPSTAVPEPSSSFLAAGMLAAGSFAASRLRRKRS